MSKSYYDRYTATLLPVAQVREKNFTFIQSTETSWSVPCRGTRKNFYLPQILGNDRVPAQKHPFAPSRLCGEDPRKNFHFHKMYGKVGACFRNRTPQRHVLVSIRHVLRSFRPPPGTPQGNEKTTTLITTIPHAFNERFHIPKTK